MAGDFARIDVAYLHAQPWLSRLAAMPPPILPTPITVTSLGFTAKRSVQDWTSRLALAIDISMPMARPSVTMAVPP
jgi:hypothetical protein